MDLTIKERDRVFYEKRLADFLPARLIDVHTHIWLASFYDPKVGVSRSAAWPRLVANENSIEELMETYRLLLPRQQVTPVVFGMPERDIVLDMTNAYASQVVKERGLPGLLVSLPEWTTEETERRVIEGGFLGLKPYLNFAPQHIPAGEIAIFDFLPRHQLEVADAHGWIVVLHIPRPERLKDPVNLEQMQEIERRYPNVRLIIAHVGRAYCDSDVGGAFEVLRSTERMMFDFSANTNAHVFEQFLRVFGPKRVMYGSDLPILRMRVRRICEAGKYINLVPPGLYGDVSVDPHMRELDAVEAERLTFFLYELLWAIRRASEAVGLSHADVEDMFYHNAVRLLDGVRTQ